MSGRRLAAVGVAVTALAAGLVTYAASLRHSATFDEIVLVSGGARAVAHDRWDMITDQPPLMLWLYGWAVRGADPELPPEDRPWTFADRWDHARLFFFGLGNDAQALLARARAVSAAMTGALVGAAGGFGWWAAGPVAGVGAALLVALMPDVLAHGGVAYNDLPLALAFLLAIWAMDAALRRPSAARGALAGLAVAATFGMKLSALALLPIAVLLVAAEAAVRGRDPGWWRDAGATTAVGAMTAYAGLVVLYRWDLSLTLLRFNFWRTVLHATGGHEAPAYLLGETAAGGWWYYFPVAALFKTPAAVQALALVAALVLVGAWWTGGGGWRPIVRWRGRGALLGAVVFAAFLVRSDLNAGFRYALPVLPLAAVVIAVGLTRAWSSAWSNAGARGAGRSPIHAAGGRAVGPLVQTASGRAARWAIGALLLAQAVSVLSFYPHFLAYSSVWAGGRDRAWRVLADSNVDWGQGLLELRSFMRDEGVPSVRLSYFGSARPESYGIEYVALPSFFRLPLERTPGAEASPRFTVISATNLVGLYLQGFDPFAVYRDREPYRVLGHSLFVFDEAEPNAPFAAQPPGPR